MPLTVTQADLKFRFGIGIGLIDEIVLGTTRPRSRGFVAVLEQQLLLLSQKSSLVTLA